MPLPIEYFVHEQHTDTDNSGYLDRSELADMMRNLGISFKDLEQDIDAIFGEKLIATSLKTILTLTLPCFRHTRFRYGRSHHLQGVCRFVRTNNPRVRTERPHVGGVFPIFLEKYVK
jgi:hypothetical protein